MIQGRGAGHVLEEDTYLSEVGDTGHPQPVPRQVSEVMLCQVLELDSRLLHEPQFTVDQRQARALGRRGVLPDKVPDGRGELCEASLLATQEKHLDAEHAIGVLYLGLLPER